MLKSEILELLNQGEGPKLEYKQDNIRPESLARQIVSFANMNGGRILVGVEDDGSISGIQRENFQEWLMDTVVGQYIHPFVLTDYEELNHEDKKVVVVTVSQGSAKPYVLKNKGREDIYVRYGNTCQLADRVQQARLFDTGGLISAEKFPVHGSVLGDLDSRRYQEYFNSIFDTVQMPEIQALLQSRSFLVGEQNALNCSYFAYALFAKHPTITPTTGWCKGDCLSER